jgi:ATP-dependent Lon protease
MADQADQKQADKGQGRTPLPPDSMIVLPVRQTVLFPRHRVALGNCTAIFHRRRPGSGSQRANAGRHPANRSGGRGSKVGAIAPVGTAAQILRYVTAADGTHHVVAQGMRRFRVIEFLPNFPFLVARVEEIGIVGVMTAEVEARVSLVRSRAREAIELLPNVPGEVAAAIEKLDSASALADFIAGIIDAKPSEKQEVLETIDIKERLDKVLALQSRSANRRSNRSPPSSASIFCASSFGTFRRNWAKATRSRSKSPS